MSVNHNSKKSSINSLSSRVVPGESKRTDFPLDLAKTALLVIDVQAYLSSEDSETLASSEKEQNEYLYQTSLPKAIQNIQQMAALLRKHRDNNQRRYGCEVIFTYLEALTHDCRDVSLDYKLSGPKLAQLPCPQAPATFLPAPSPSTSTGKGDILIPKTSCSVFQSTNLAYVLRNLQVEQLIITGQLTDQCVESAVRDGADQGFFITVAEDACAAMSELEHRKGLAGMKGFARIMTTNQILVEMEQAAVAYSTASGTYDNTPSSEKEAATTTKTDHDNASANQTPSISIQPVEKFQRSPQSRKAGTIVALIRSLKHAGVKFLRYATVDVGNSIRCKAKPLSSISHTSNDNPLEDQISIAEVCFAGLPRYADSAVAASNLSAARSLVLQPDLGSLRILPYAPLSAMCFGYAYDPTAASLSPFCTRGLLARVLQSARDEFGLVFHVGAELEFQLFPCSGDLLPVDGSLFADSVTLNEQEAFIGDLCNQLSLQDIPIELVHAESANGQLEVVLQYQPDPLAVADCVVLARETIRACAKAHKMKALFLPKTNSNQAGSGLHLHFSFSDVSSMDQNDFPASMTSSLLSPRASSFLEGILVHLPGLLALTMPTINSFRRVGPGCWTGHDVRWAIEDKEAPVRICLDVSSQKATHAELKLMDSTSNIYLALSCILAAGLHGIHDKLELRRSSAGPGPGGQHDCPKLPASFADSLDCLASDSHLLNVLGKELSTAYLAVKRDEVQHYSSMSLEDEVAEAFRKA